MRRLVGPIISIAMMAFVMVGSTVAQSVDCLGAEYLAEGGIVVINEHSADQRKVTEAMSVAESEVLVGTASRGKLADIAVGPAGPKLSRVFLVEVAQDATPYVAQGSITGPQVLVSSPCSVVVLDEAGTYLFTYSFAVPVDRDS